MATQLATISDQKSALQKWTPVIAFDVILKDGTPRYWAKQALSFGGNSYIAIVLDHSEFRVEGNGVYGVDAVMEISLSLNNADANLNSIIVPQNWQGGTIQPRFFFLNPEDGSSTTDSIVYPKFLIDLPRATWPRVEFSAHNKWNLARKMLPVSLVTRKDRYPFPDTAAERALAGSDPSSEFYASGYDPATGKGNWKTAPSTPYTRADYDGTREKLKEIGLEVRFGGFGKAPPTIVATPRKGEKADYFGNANEAKYGQAVPLVFGQCRIQPIVLDTGFPTAWNGSRLSHYLLSDGVNFAPEHINGIEDVLDVFIPDNPKFQRIPETSGEPQTTGAWSFQGGYYGSQKAPASSKYRNIDQAVDFPEAAAEFPDRDLYSGLAYLEVGFPKELSGQDGVGPKIEAIVKGLKLEYWDTGGSSDWAWTDNPIWIFIHLLKLLRWTKADLDLASIATAAGYCSAVLANGKKRFRCNLALTQQTRAADVLRGIRNNCRMYTAFAPNGKLQLKIAQNVAGEGGLAFALDGTNIMRGEDGQLRVEKFHRSIFEMANWFSVSFQNEENFYNVDSVTKADIANINQIDEKVSADSIFPILGIPSFDQAERQIEWMRQEQTTLNEYYKVVCSLALIENKVGQIGTITEGRHGLVAQQVRIRAMAPGPEAATVELTLQKHSDGVYTDLSVSTPTTRAQGDSSYSPRAVGGKFAASPAPILTEITVADPINADTSVRRIRVEFKPPEQTYEGIFSRETKIRDVIVLTSGGTIPGDQVLFVEVAPVKADLRGLASEFLMVNVPAGGNSNSFSVKCQLPSEADEYILFVGNFPGQTYEQTVAASPGTSEFTITVTTLNRNFGSIPPDPKFDHVHVFYTYNSSPDVLRDGGRTFSPTESLIEFEPEAPAAEDTQVTVYVSSVNAAEDDFYPINISPKALLTLTYENGAAENWQTEVLPGPTPSSVMVKVTRPSLNAKRLFWITAQFKDTSVVPTWRELDDNAGPAQTYYDGSAIAHESIGGLKIKKDPAQPLGFGTAKYGDLIMLDVAGGSFDRNRCQWATVDLFLDDLGAETVAANARYIALTGGLFRPQTTQDLRMKIVRAPWVWDTEGYLGNPDAAGFAGYKYEWVGDREGTEFLLGPYEVGQEVTSLDARTWVENDYCRSGSGLPSDDHVHVFGARDDVIPGLLVDLLVEGDATGTFTATWKDPLTGNITIDDTAVSYADNSSFTAANTSAGHGRRNIVTGLDPGKSYYFRLAVHNKSGEPSHASTISLGATGWGPWTVYGAPDLVSSGLGGPKDDVIPGPVVGLSVVGADGKFTATWEDPATGNLTIDDTAISWATNPGFTIGQETATGWGHINRESSVVPGKTYYWRVAVHNQSGDPSHASTISLGATGWGPWTVFGAPNAVSSGGIPGAPVDTVIPGAVVGLSVSGLADGRFIATWSDPTTGYETIDDVAVQWSADAAFTSPGTAPGWGDVHRLEGYDPGKTYYWRLAVHNQSNQPSHASTVSLGATGWGPWTLPAINPVTSGTTGVAPSDTVLPGALQNLTVTSVDGEFIAKWDFPLTGANTLDDIREQYALDAGFTSGLVTTGGLGPVKTVRGTDPNKTYYFRFAAHNKSGLPSDSSTAAALGATGWGMWTYPAVNPVSSSTVPGAPIDNVIPGLLQNVMVQGIGGDFIATWDFPSTGNLTIDDIREQYATDAGFTQNLVTTGGLGPVKYAKGTDPNKTYYFRFAAHNQSGKPSDSSTASVLGPTGWGAWSYPAINPVNSNLIPLDGTQYIDTNLVPNGSFEIDTNSDNYPDGWFVYEVGTTGYSWGMHSFKYDGKYGLILASGATGGRFGVASDAFPVTVGEQLSFSVWAFSGTAANGGLIVRIVYNPDDPNFLVATAQEDLFYGINPASTWTKYEKTFTVPAGVGFARIALYNYWTTAATDSVYHIDDVQIIRRISGKEIKDNTIPSARLTGSARADFVETFDQALDPDGWTLSQNGTVTYPNNGQDGGRTVMIQGSKTIQGKYAIPFDPRKLYRVSCKMYVNSLVGPANSQIFLGVVTHNASGTQLNYRYVAANGFQWYGVLGAEWHTFTGYIKGLGTNYIVPTPDAANPSNLDPATASISPIMVVGYPAEAPAGNVYQIDDFKIESYDEQIYESSAPNGTFSSLTKVVIYPHPAGVNDAKTSAVNLYWDYTQGLVKAQQFAISITDGYAYWVQRVRALPGTGALRHRFTVFGLTWNRSVTINIQAEAVAFGGQVAGTSSSWGTFTPNVSSGSHPGGETHVGDLDWAGGNVWWDSIQYRNNIAPSNAPGAGITIQYLSSGSGAVRARIDGLNTYSQGTYIATHLAIIIRQPDETIVLNRDMVVTYISMGSLPSTFEVPLTIPDSADCRITVAAVAETKNGRTYNTTFPAGTSKAATRIVLRPLNPGTDKVIQIGMSDWPLEWAELHTPLRIHSTADGSDTGGRIYGSAGKFYVESPNAIYVKDATSEIGSATSGALAVYSYPGGYLSWRGASDTISTDTAITPNRKIVVRVNGTTYYLLAREYNT